MFSSFPSPISFQIMTKNQNFLEIILLNSPFHLFSFNRYDPFHPLLSKHVPLFMPGN